MAIYENDPYGKGIRPLPLGLLRFVLDRRIRAKDQIAIHEVPSAHIKLSTTMLHDLLDGRRS